MVGKVEKSVVSKTTPNKDTNNKKRKEPEPKVEKTVTTKATPENKKQIEKPTTTTTTTTDNKKSQTEKPKTTTTTNTIKTTPENKKQTEKPTTTTTTTNADKTNKNNKTSENTKTTENTKPKQQQQPQAKKQKSEPTSTPTPTTTTTTTTTTKETTQPQKPFSIFDSLKKSESTNTKQEKNEKTTTTASAAAASTTIKKTEKSNKTSLLKAFSSDNQYSEPNVTEINEKIDDVLKEIKELNPDEFSRKDDKTKQKLKMDSKKIREEQNPRTVFVSNINLNHAKDNELKQLFKPFGQIESIRFRSIPLSSIDGNRKETFIKKEFHEKRETCNAYIVFKQIADAKKAVKQMNGKEAFGKHLRVDMADHKPTKASDAKTIFIGNIPYETEEEELFLIFDKTFGDVVSVRIIRDSHTNIGKGFGYVNFSTDETASTAIAQKSIQFGKREIRIFPTKENPKKGKTIKEKKKLLNKKPSTRGASQNKSNDDDNNNNNQDE
ncbi:hypothetical protein ACTFIR_002257 [Dictyostelium discoideum]